VTTTAIAAVAIVSCFITIQTTTFSLCSQQVFTVELPSEASYVSTAEISAKAIGLFPALINVSSTPATL
jgi:hypothetical protein